jgi:hypothetical protein
LQLCYRVSIVLTLLPLARLSSFLRFAFPRASKLERLIDKIIRIPYPLEGNFLPSILSILGTHKSISPHRKRCRYRRGLIIMMIKSWIVLLSLLVQYLSNINIYIYIYIFLTRVDKEKKKSLEEEQKREGIWSRLSWSRRDM